MAEEMKVLLAGYPSQQLAETDFGVLQTLVNEGAVPLDDAAVVVKDAEGRSAVVKDLHKPVRKGLLIGAVLGALTPVGLIAGVVAGGAGGKLASLFHKGVSQATLRDVGDFMEANTVVLVIAGSPAAVEMVRDTMKEATGFLSQTIGEDGQAIRQAVEAEPEP
jgi:uncharacterized membrane protein